MQIRMYSGSLHHYVPVLKENGAPDLQDKGPGFTADVNPQTYKRYIKALKEFEEAFNTLFMEVQNQ